MVRAKPHYYPIPKPEPAEPMLAYGAGLIRTMVLGADPAWLDQLARVNARRADELDALAGRFRRYGELLAEGWSGTAALLSQQDLRGSYVIASSLAGGARQMSQALAYAAGALAAAQATARFAEGGGVLDNDPTSLTAVTVWQPLLARLNAAYREAIQIAPSQLAAFPPAGDGPGDTWQDFSE
ncbi:MAG: hypothetical protein HYR62_09615 [Actinobacteria bacterium]|nr:hypothetical protein [Actinomycetota bacterium]MBI3687988.1 hypothetical protein [Actinomycetota bacterium]